MKRALRSRALVRSAWRALEAGPASTSDLVRVVLGLKRASAAAETTLFALLGEDSRFRVDAEGTWSLREGARRPGTPLSEIAYAVVDVETTGGAYEAGHRVTEIAIVHVRRGSVVGEFQTLVRPGRRVPLRIQRLTGITDEMLETAPTFDQVAGRVARELGRRVFVAHNVAFDWGWVRRELAASLGGAPRLDRLCTVRLARRLVPELRSRSLDAVARFFGVPVRGRHRALGDARAAARILIQLLRRAEARGACDLDSLRRCRTPPQALDQGDLFQAARVGIRA